MKPTIVQMKHSTIDLMRMNDHHCIELKAYQYRSKSYDLDSRFNKIVSYNKQRCYTYQPPQPKIFRSENNIFKPSIRI